MKPDTGRLLIIAAESDCVIPGEVIQLIETFAAHASSCQCDTAPSVSHHVITDLRTRASKHLKEALGLITEMLRMVV